MKSVESVNPVNPTSKDEGARGSGVRLPLLQWLAERLSNCERIADGKADGSASRDAWLEEASYIKAAMLAIAHLAGGYDAIRSTETQRDSTTGAQGVQ